jgi:hypothetical protein
VHELRRNTDDTVQAEATLFSLSSLLRTEAELHDSFVADVRKVPIAFLDLRMQNSDDGDTLKTTKSRDDGI